MDQQPTLIRPDLLAALPALPTPQQARSRDKRQALLDAALTLFTHRGYERTTINDIAAAAGTAVGSFYQYFGSKQQIVVLLMDMFVKESDALDFTPRADEDIRTQMHALIEQALAVDAHYAGVYRAWRDAIRGDLALAAIEQQIQDWSAARLALILGALGQLPGARPNTDHAALATMLNLLFWELIARMDQIDLEAAINSVTALIYHTMFVD